MFFVRLFLLVGCCFGLLVAGAFHLFAFAAYWNGGTFSIRCQGTVVKAPEIRHERGLFWSVRFSDRFEGVYEGRTFSIACNKLTPVVSDRFWLGLGMPLVGPLTLKAGDPVTVWCNPEDRSSAVYRRLPVEWHVIFVVAEVLFVLLGVRLLLRMVRGRPAPAAGT